MGYCATVFLVLTILCVYDVSCDTKQTVPPTRKSDTKHWNNLNQIIKIPHDRGNTKHLEHKDNTLRFEPQLDSGNGAGTGHGSWSKMWSQLSGYNHDNVSVYEEPDYSMQYEYEDTQDIDVSFLTHGCMPLRDRITISLFFFFNITLITGPKSNHVKQVPGSFLTPICVSGSCLTQQGLIQKVTRRKQELVDN